MRRAAVTLAVALAVAALVAGSCSSDDVAAGGAEPSTPTEAATSPGGDALDRAESIDPTEVDGAAAGADDAEHPLPSASARAATATRLADGDSFDITWADSGDRDEIRLIGLNAPEGDACFGDRSRTVLAELVEGQTLLVDGIERDEFGRVLADVWVGTSWVNGEMVERGAALALSDGAPHGQWLADAQARAQLSATGLWSTDACGADASLPVRIADIEFNAPGPDNENPNGEWIEVTNDGVEPIDLTGWSIRDESTRNRYSFPSEFLLGAGASVRVLSGCGPDTGAELYWCARDPVWNNGGDTGFLVDPDGRFGDFFSYSG